MIARHDPTPDPTERSAPPNLTRVMPAPGASAPRRRRVALAIGAGIALIPTIYPLVLLAAAVRGLRLPFPRDDSLAGRFLVLVPAHDEQDVIAKTLRRIAEADYPADHVTTIVIADNCSDRTGDVAADGGAEVLVRRDSLRRGKGHALAWALDELGDRISSSDAVVFIDADCAPSANFFSAIAARLTTGASAAQVNYTVANPDDSWSAALRWGAFALMNFVRPLGRDSLGLSCGISGTGFALTPDLLSRHPWSAFSLSEDHEYHLRLVAAGERVTFVREASVTSPMPTTLSASREQNLRWEGGKWQLVRRWAPSLLAGGARNRDHRCLLAAVELLLPPQSLLLACNCALASSGLIVRSRGLTSLGIATACGQAVYVFGGFRVAGAPTSVYTALAMAPRLAAWKIALQLRVLAGRGPSDWIGTRAGNEHPIS